MEKTQQRANRIHLAASIIPPLTLLLSVAFTVMYRAAGEAWRWLTPLCGLVFFVAGYFIMCLEERIFHYPRTPFDIDDGVSETTRRYVRKRFLILPTILAAIPGFLAVPIVDDEIKRLVNAGVGDLDYYSEDFIAPWLVCGVIIVGAILGASARMNPGNVAITPFSVMFYGVCHAAIFIINLFMEVPSTLPTLLFTAMIVISLFELNAAAIEDISRKVGDASGIVELRETNFAHVKRIAVNFFRVFIVPFLLTAAFSVVWQYLLETRLNQPL